MKRTLLAMALLVSSVFGVTGCGSDDDEAPVESRIKNSTIDDGRSFTDFREDHNLDIFEDRADHIHFHKQPYSPGIIQYKPEGVSSIFAPLILINGRRYGTDNIGDSRDDAAAASKSGADSTDVDDDYVEEDADSSDDEDDEEDEIEEP